MQEQRAKNRNSRIKGKVKSADAYTLHKNMKRRQGKKCYLKATIQLGKMMYCTESNISGTQIRKLHYNLKTNVIATSHTERGLK